MAGREVGSVAGFSVVFSDHRRHRTAIVGLHALWPSPHTVLDRPLADPSRTSSIPRFSCVRESVRSIVPRSVKRPRRRPRDATPCPGALCLITAKSRCGSDRFARRGSRTRPEPRRWKWRSALTECDGALANLANRLRSERYCGLADGKRPRWMRQPWRAGARRHGGETPAGHRTRRIRSSMLVNFFLGAYDILYGGTVHTSPRASNAFAKPRHRVCGTAWKRTERKTIPQRAIEAHGHAT